MYDHIRPLGVEKTVFGEYADMRSYSHRDRKWGELTERARSLCTCLARPLLSYRGVRCAAIHSHRWPLEMGIGRKDASPCAHARAAIVRGTYPSTAIGDSVLSVST